MPREEEQKSMLIVEDDDTLRVRLATAMQKRGFITRSASSVAEVIAAINVEAPEYALLTSDYRMAVAWTLSKRWNKVTEVRGQSF